MRGTSDDTNMMHRQQRQSSSFLRSNSSRGSDTSSEKSSKNINNNNNNNDVISSLSNDYSSPLSILSRRCSYNRSRTSTNVTTTLTPSTRCYKNNSTRNSSTSSCPVLLSVIAWSVTLLLISSSLGIADAGVLMGHPLGKRSFLDIHCKGVYDRSLFARLDRICEDCYNLFREPQLHSLCSKNCFTSDYFKGCLDVLLLEDEMEEIQTWIKQLHGADPGV